MKDLDRMRSRQPASPAQALLAALMGALLFFLLVSIPARTLAQQPPPPEFHVEAVRGTGWNETSPPAEDSVTATVSPRAFRVAPTRAARMASGGRSDMRLS